MSAPASGDLLATIIAATRRTLELRERDVPLAALMRRAERRAVVAGRFRAALARTDRYNVIAECKRRSPSKGVLRAEYDPVSIASGYARAGAAAISVLTEPAFFDGALAHLEAVRAAVDLPILRKDFVIKEYQLLEARAAGADAVLLIVSALSAGDLQALSRQATALELDVLVEVHDAEELRRAVDAGATVIGVNNRNLRTLTVDVHVSEALVAQMPVGAIAVSESGLRTAADLVRLRGLGYGAFLIGERFMTEPDPGDALGRLLGEVVA
ncbi:MAG: indole-3-glycerol phosphate synthase TrpC [Vicinamibacterales bacterium]